MHATECAAVVLYNCERLPHPRKVLTRHVLLLLASDSVSTANGRAPGSAAVRCMPCDDTGDTPPLTPTNVECEYCMSERFLFRCAVRYLLAVRKAATRAIRSACRTRNGIDMDI